MPTRRVRPSDNLWPGEKEWERLQRLLSGKIYPGVTPLIACRRNQGSGGCHDVARLMRNPYFLGDQPGVAQISGWPGAWRSEPSAVVAEVRSCFDVAACVNFARVRNLRLVVRGGGHSYTGTSSCPDSLMIWTRRLNQIVIEHDSVSVEAGAVWMDVYHAVTTLGNRYVQGGGCATVGVPGLIQSGGFGSFSKTFGTAAGGLIEAQIVTADGQIRTVNEAQDPELFWAIKGGGGGNFGVVTRVKLRTYSLPPTFGDISVELKADSEGAFRTLVGRFFRFYRDELFNEHWGENVAFRPGNILSANMVFTGVAKTEASQRWRRFLQEATADGHTVAVKPLFVEALPARHWWDPDYLQTYSPGSVFLDDRPGAPPYHAWWQGDARQAGEFIHGYESGWLPAELLNSDSIESLADGIFASSRVWTTTLQFNKGLARAPRPVRDDALDTATNPAICTAFALVTIAGGAQPSYVGDRAIDPRCASTRSDMNKIHQAMLQLQDFVKVTGAYLSESSYYQSSWQRAFWGRNHLRLAAVKAAYDPNGLLFVHQGIGSERWSADGFTPLTSHW